MEFLQYIRTLLGSDALFQIIISLAIIVLTVIFAKAVSFITKKIIRPFVEKSKSDYDDKLLEVLEGGIFKLLIIGGFYLVLDNLRSGYLLWYQIYEIDLVKQYPYLDQLIKILDYLLFVTFIIVLLFVLFKIITIVFDWYAEKINAEDNRNLSGSLFPLLKKVSKIILAALAIVVILSKFTIDISAFVVSLGVGSLAIALAAQETLSNMISGFIIMIDRPFRIGDRIRYAETQIGDVIEIGIRSTKILDFDNNLVIIPNNEIVKTRIINITYPNILTRVVIEVGVAYGTDIAKVREVMLGAAKAHPLVTHDIAPEVNFMNFGESSVDVRLVARTADYRNAFGLTCELRETIYNLFSKEGIEIPFPQRVIHTAPEKKK